MPYSDAIKTVPDAIKSAMSSDIQVAMYFTAGMLAIAVAIIVIGLSNHFSVWIKSVTRNPEVATSLLVPAILGMALIEIALLSVMGGMLKILFAS